MIRIRQLKLHTDHSEADLKKKICKSLHMKEDALLSYSIVKQSIDARKKPDLYYVYTVDVHAASESKLLKKNKDNNISYVEKKDYQLPDFGEQVLNHCPVVIGSGPAGMFCAYMLAENGYQPLILERGACVDDRTEDVERFWKTGVLNPDSNVQFGEGGAGTFSDGKLNTLVKDSFGRNHKVLEIFVENGAPEEILYQNKPHIGTDILSLVVKNMRNHILECGGEILFHHKMTDINTEDDRLRSITVCDLKTNRIFKIDTDLIVLAIGHSARDTFQMLSDHHIQMEAKPFAVGVRIQHKQKMIDESQYGKERGKTLPAASYKLTANLENGRSVYTFCMCPGGYVVNASSEEQMLAINGMSYHDRGSANANSAVIVSVNPQDYPGNDALSGVAFQRELERRAYEAGKGKIPVQLFKDYCYHTISDSVGDIEPLFKGDYEYGDVRGIFPTVIGDSIEAGIKAFDQKIHGYASDDAVLAGVESRTSSPVKIVRDASLQSNFGGIYPCGEGAGYAGGITSAAMDGLKVAEAIVKLYRPFDSVS